MGKAQSQEIVGNAFDAENHKCDHSMSYKGDDI